MNIFRVGVPEVWVRTFEVEAETAEDARELVQNGAAAAVEEDFEYSHTRPLDDYSVECVGPVQNVYTITDESSHGPRTSKWQGATAEEALAQWHRSIQNEPGIKFVSMVVEDECAHASTYAKRQH